MLGTRQGLIFRQRHFGTEQKIRQSPFVQHTVDDDRPIFDLKVKAVFLGAEAIHHMSVALDFSKTIAPPTVQILLGHMEFLQQLKLF